MRLNQFYKYIIIIVYLGGLNAKVHIPKGIKENIELTIHGKEWIYYELDDEGLIYDNIGKQYNIGDSIKVGIYSRTIMSATGKGKKDFGFSVQINDNEPLKLKYNKEGSDATSKERPGWSYTNSGIWYYYFPVEENVYRIKILPIDSKPVIYLRLTSNKIIKKGRFTGIINTVNHQDKTKLETMRRNNQKKGPISTLWYLLNERNVQQFEIRGPSTVRIFSRILFDNNLQTDDYYILVKEDGIDLGTYHFITDISDESLVVKTQNPVSKWRSIWITIPEGKHFYTLSLPSIKDNKNHTALIRLKAWAVD